MYRLTVTIFPCGTAPHNGPLSSRKGNDRKDMRLIPSIKRPVRIPSHDGIPRYPFKEHMARVRTLIYRGNRVECSCCGKTFSLFLFSPYMTALCPNCLSMERYRLICRYLREETDFGSEKVRLLDIAPDWSFQEFCRSYPNVDYVSIDIQSPLAIKHMDIRDLKFPDDSFDCILCYHVLEHIDDDMLALAELRRVLRPGGWALIQVPIQVEKTVERIELSREEQKDILKWPGHLRAYGKDYADRLEEAGFEVEVVDYVRSFTEEEIKRFGFDPEEDLYFCYK